MKDKKILIFIIILLLGSLLVWMFNYKQKKNHMGQVEINGHKFEVKIVSSDEDRRVGLGKRKILGSDQGMLFIFPEAGIHGFWMKDMQFDLDIIWIEGDMVVHLAKNIPSSYPYTLVPDHKADKVLEINSGLSEKYAIKIGSKVKIEL